MIDQLKCLIRTKQCSHFETFYPRSREVIKKIYKIKKSSEKQTIIVLIVFSANGSIIPLMIVYLYNYITTKFI